MNHTPGPWKILDTFVVAGPDNRIICAMGSFVEARDTEAANARLIAAAPELVAALEDMLAGFEDTLRRFGHGCGDAAKARAVLAKAKEQA